MSLYSACCNHEVNEVSRILDLTEDIEDIQRDSGESALYASCKFGHGDIVKLLLDKGNLYSIFSTYELLVAIIHFL